MKDMYNTLATMSDFSQQVWQLNGPSERFARDFDSNGRDLGSNWLDSPPQSSTADISGVIIRTATTT